MDKNFIKGLVTGIVGMLIIIILYLFAFSFNNILLNNGILRGLNIFLGDNNKSTNTIDTEKKFKEIMSYIDNYYYKDVEKNKLIESTYKGLVQGLEDPYSTYLSKEELSSFIQETEGKYSGIGVVISYDEEKKQFVVSLPFAGGPGAKAGLLPGDIIVKVDDKNIDNQDFEELVKMIKGKEGTKVNVTVYRKEEDKFIDKEITREEINIPTVEHKMLSNKVGYLRITQFDEVTYNQFMKAFNELEKQDQKGLIIDLRNNPGGLYSSVLAIADELLPKSLIVYTEDKNGKKEEEFSDDEKQFKKPLVLLVNENSASASEILAGAIKDHKKGTIIGTKTFGKGLVQRLLPLSDGAGIKLTIQKYFTPSGNYIHEKGISPDIEVTLPEELKKKLILDEKEDIQLKRAIEEINTKIK